MRFGRLSLFGGATILISALFAGLAGAEPLVTADGKPAIVTAWSGAGNKVTLTLKAGTDAKAVAAAIEEGVERVKAKVKGGQVLVIGKSEADLLKALAEVDFGGDDLGALAAAAGGDDDADSGSSLRAKQTADLAKLLKDRSTLASGRVSSVSYGKFPNTVVSVKVLGSPTGPLGKKIRKGKTIKFKPLLKGAGAKIDFSEENTQHNAGAWYLMPKDSVKIKVGKELEPGLFEAVVITR